MYGYVIFNLLLSGQGLVERRDRPTRKPVLLETIVAFAQRCQIACSCGARDGCCRVAVGGVAVDLMIEEQESIFRVVEDHTN